MLTAETQGGLVKSAAQCLFQGQQETAVVLFVFSAFQMQYYIGKVSMMPLVCRENFDVSLMNVVVRLIKKYMKEPRDIHSSET